MTCEKALARDVDESDASCDKRDVCCVGVVCSNEVRDHGAPLGLRLQDVFFNGVVEACDMWIQR